MNFKLKNVISRIVLRNSRYEQKSDLPAKSVQLLEKRAESVHRPVKNGIAFSTTAALSALAILASKGTGRTVAAKGAERFVRNSKKYAAEFVNGFLKGQNKELEKFIQTADFSQYGKNGLPLKYSRKQFVNDINETIKNLPSEKQEKVLSQFNLSKGLDDIDGIPLLTEKLDNTSESGKIKELIENFYYNNETTFNNPDVKKNMDVIIKGFPQFNMTIGKTQHKTHIYSVDIHSLNVLQKAMRNPNYDALSQEGKAVIKLTALVHDFGKKGNVITRGHALVSKGYVEKFIDSYDLSQSVKERVLNQVENHHWFEKYNKGILDTKDVINIFKTPEDIQIAKIIAKADFESIGNGFHLHMLQPFKVLTQAEFDEEFAQRMSKIKNS